MYLHHKAEGRNSCSGEVRSTCQSLPIFHCSYLLHTERAQEFPHTRAMEPPGGCTHGRFSDILKWDSNHPADICWESNTASCKHSKRLLESVDNFLIQVLNRLTGEEALLDLLLINMKEMVKGVETGGSLGCSNHGLLSWLSS